MTLHKLILSCCLLALLVSTACQPAQATPTPQETHETHPRLFFDAEDIPALKEKAKAAREQWPYVRRFARALHGEVPPAGGLPDGEQTYFEANKLIALAFTCVITEETEDCDTAKNHLLTYAGWENWGVGTRRSLNFARLLMANALAYDWLYNDLTTEERATVRTALAKQTQKLYEASIEPRRDSWDNWWGKSYMQNHYWSIHSGLGVAGLALLDADIRMTCTIKPQAGYTVNLRADASTDAEILGKLTNGQSAEAVTWMDGADGYRWWQLADGAWVRSDVVEAAGACDAPGQSLDPQVWIDHAAEKLAIGHDILENIGDGTWHESASYQNYMLALLLPFMHNLQKIQGRDIIPDYYLENYVEWRICNHIPNTTQTIFAHGDFEWDWVNPFHPQTTLRYIAAAYGNGQAEWMAQRLDEMHTRSADVYGAPWYVFELLYYDPDIEAVEPDAAQHACTFWDLQGVVWRAGDWGDDDLIFALKAGTYGGRYAFDTFVEETDPWDPPCRETGCSLNISHDHDDTNGFYLNDSGYWLAPENVGVDKHETFYHNTLLIDGEGQYRPPEERYDVYPEDFAGRGGSLEISFNALGFHYTAADATRRYDIEGLADFTRHVLFIHDQYFVMLDNLVAENPHTYTWVIHAQEDAWQQDGWLFGDAGDGHILDIGVLAPQPFNVEFGDDGYPYIRVAPKEPAYNMRFINLLYPTRDYAWAETPAANLLDDTGEVAVVRVTPAADGPTDDIILNYAEAPSEVETSAYTYDGKIAVITRTPDGALAQLFVYGGAALHGESTLIERAEPDGAVRVDYNGGEVVVTGRIGDGEVTLYAPDADTLMVNGEPREFTRSGDLITFR